MDQMSERERKKGKKEERKKGRKEGRKREGRKEREHPLSVS
jgi:hypothetical protein